MKADASGSGLTIEAIRGAADVIRGQVVRTPCAHSKTLSSIAGAEVYLKFENLQFTASFKDRGALVKLASLDEPQRRRGVIAMSAGNHAQAVAYHAGRFGIPAVIVMPRRTPNTKVEHTREFGAEVVLHGDDLSEAGEHAEALSRQRGLTFVHPYDDVRVMAGQGTVALEILETVPDLDVLVVPIGGGGLIAGIAVAAKALRPDIRVVGVEAARYPSMRQALRGEPIACGRSTIAEGIAVKKPGTVTLSIIRELVDEIYLVGEDELEQAVQYLLEIEKTVVEGAGAAGLAALLKHRDAFAGQSSGLVLSGGNIDPLLLSSIIQRGLVRSGRLVRLLVEIQDVPGVLSDVTRRVAEAEGNIVEVHHQRAFTQLPVQAAELELLLHTRGLKHRDDIIAALEQAGHPVRAV